MAHRLAHQKPRHNSNRPPQRNMAQIKSAFKYSTRPIKWQKYGSKWPKQASYTSLMTMTDASLRNSKLSSMRHIKNLKTAQAVPNEYFF